MRVTRILAKEHDLILRMLKQLSMARKKLEHNEAVPVPFFEKAVKFSQNFADQFHHFKEEFLMFGLLAQKKNGSMDAEIGALRYQHERCRSCIAEITRSLIGYANEDEIATTNLLENLSGYISLLKRHIYIEDHIYFPMMTKSITKDEEEMLLMQFRSEEKRIGDLNGFDPSKQLLEEMTGLLE